MAQDNVFTKDPDAILDYHFDWAGGEDWLDDDAISSSSWIVPSGITNDLDTNTTTVATIWLSGGTAGQTYVVVNRIVTVDGRTNDASIIINVREVTDFSYRATLGTDRDKVRYYLQDVVLGAGPRPADGNFTDSEINGLITAEGSWQRAVAGGFETLAAAWRRYPSFKADGLSLNRSDIAKGYAEDAKGWRKRFGTAIPVGVAGIIRVDGYSDDVASDSVRTSSEYESTFEYVRPG